jgi:SAM-dependent methyltransferase
MPAPDRTPCLAVVMPCFNESDYIEEAIEAVLASPWTAELIVVDDGSDDDTATLADKAATFDDRVRVVRQPCNLGKGAALRRGFREVTAPFVIVQDADLEYDPDDWDVLLPPLLTGDADVVYGSRFTAAGPHRVLYYWHSIGNRLLTTLSNMATNVNLTDMETCSKVFRREVVQSVDLVEDRFGFEPEITAKIAQQGWRIYEVGISYRGRTYEEGKKIGWRDGVRAVWCIARYSRPGERVSQSLVRTPSPQSATGIDEALVPTLTTLEAAGAYADWIVDLIVGDLGDEILEVGAGTGTITVRLAEHGHVVAVEPLAGAAERLRAVVPSQGVEVIEGTVDAVPADRTFDSAVLVNVLEHVDDDVALLRDLGARLRPGGALVCFVPAHAWLHSGFDDQIGHHRRYRRATLAEAYAAAGFTVEELRYVNVPGAIAWLLGTRTLGLRPNDTSTAVYERTVLPLVRRFEPGRSAPFGQSLVAVGRRATG